MQPLPKCLLPAQALTGQQLQEARDEAAALHLQLVQLKASHQQLQISQVITASSLHTHTIPWHSLI